jgi:poly(beta-D-mannuronate) lyase
MKSFFLTSFVCFAACVSAKELPVDSPEAFAAACAEAKPGDKLVLRSGEWRDAHLVFTAHGTVEAPITVSAAVPGKTLLTGSSRLAFHGEHLVARGLVFTRGYIDSGSVVQFGQDKAPASNCRLTESAINAYNNPDHKKRYNWVQLTGQGHRVDHNRFEGGDHWGLTVQVVVGQGDNRHHIDHNAFLNRTPGNDNGFETIQVGQSQDSLRDSNSVVEYNYFEACDGELEIISNKSCNNVYRKNTFVRCAGSLTLRHGDRSTVEANIFLGGGKPNTSGVRVIGRGHNVRGNYFHGLTGVSTGGVIAIYAGIPNSIPTGYFDAENTTVAENVLIDNQANGIHLSAGYLSRNRTILPRGVKILNNWIDLHPHTGAVVLAGTPTDGLVYEGNFYTAHSELGYAPPRGGFKQTPYKNPANPDLPIPVYPEMSAPDTKEHDGWKVTMADLELLSAANVGPSSWKP